MPLDAAVVAAAIDHTLLRAEAARSDLERLCDEAQEYHFAAVCVNPVWTSLCSRRLAGAWPRVATVIGFPLGANISSVKAEEARRAVADGATELDVVAALWALRDGDWSAVRRDLEEVMRASTGASVKVIIESALLSDAEIRHICEIARSAGAAFVKTSTGVHPAGGATVRAVEVMSAACDGSMSVKASGGIRDLPTLQLMLAAGATRIGTSAGVSIMREARR